MSDYKTPGVYVEEIVKFPPSVAQVETAIPAFIGYTEKADVDDSGTVAVKRPTRIISLLEYETLFGGAYKEMTIAVDIVDLVADIAIPLVVSKRTITVANATPSKFFLYQALQMYFANGGGPCYIISVGDYTSTHAVADFRSGKDELEKFDEPTLIVIPEAVGLSSSSTYYTLINESLMQSQKLGDRFVIIDSFNNDATKPQGAEITSEKDLLKYGAAYHPYLRTTFNYGYNESDITLSHIVNEIDSVDTAVGSADTNALDVVADGILANEIRSKLVDLTITLPPSSTMAGIYARIDSNRGVWKAPANVSVNACIEPTIKITHDAQESLNIDVNGKSVNAIRTFTGKGIMVWGARTLAGNDNEWRYISVRRFFNMAEESIKKATEQFVFEPNDKNTWVRVKAMIDNFLTLQWRAGALAGPTPEKAFYVSVGLGETMTAMDVLEGRMIIEVGMAAVRPAEFIVLKFSHKMQEA